MAKVTNAFDTYTATADREDLSNIIYNISPMQTPFMSSIGTRNVKNVVFDWQTESLPCLLYTSPSPRDVEESRMPSSA